MPLHERQQLRVGAGWSQDRAERGVGPESGYPGVEDQNDRVGVRRRTFHPDVGCPSAALLDEIGRCEDATKQAYTDGARAVLDEIAARLAPEDPQSARGKALGLFTMLVGTMQLSRALSDPKLSDEALERGLENALTLMG